MENPGINHLPEVDSLPDGFVVSCAETETPSTPIIEIEKPSGCMDGTLSESDCSSEQSHEIVVNLQTEQCTIEKTQNFRTFPASLSETESSGTSEIVEKVAMEQAETPILNVNDTFTEALIDTSGCSKIKEQVQDEFQNAVKFNNGGSDASTSHGRETILTEGVQSLKSRKSESTEVKRKNPKRTFKSEKEFLEYTLKYQKVLAERDAVIVVRDKLESLCRELQRQNKMLMDECKRASNEGQNLRTELSTKFQDAIKRRILMNLRQQLQGLILY